MEVRPLGQESRLRQGQVQALPAQLQVGARLGQVQALPAQLQVGVGPAELLAGERLALTARLHRCHVRESGKRL